MVQRYAIIKRLWSGICKIGFDGQRLKVAVIPFYFDYEAEAWIVA